MNARLKRLYCLNMNTFTKIKELVNYNHHKKVKSSKNTSISNIRVSSLSWHSKNDSPNQAITHRICGIAHIKCETNILASD